MRIESAKLEMQSSHVQHERTSASLTIMRGGQPPRAAAETGAAVADTAPPARADEEQELDDPRLSLLRTLVEKLFGQSVRVMRMSDIMPAENGGTYAPPPAASSSGNGFAASLVSERVEYEAVSFSAAGSVRTADGRVIKFEVAFEMERSFSERISIDINGGASRLLKDPLMLDFAGTGAALSDVRFAFDLDADGTLDEVPLPIGGRGFLAFDRNDNGRIDDGSELFGALTGNGFAELAALDSDGNGWIDEADPAFAKLRLWQPDANGVGKLVTLAEAGVGALSLASIATPFALRNAANETLGLMRQSGIYLNENGSVGTISQVDLTV